MYILYNMHIQVHCQYFFLKIEAKKELMLDRLFICI